MISDKLHAPAALSM